MTHEERLTFCKNCKNRELNEQQDIICGITKKTPAFEDTCENFVQERSSPQEAATAEPGYYLAGDLDDDVKGKLREHQDVLFAVIGGTAAALVGGVLWALVTVTTKYQIGYMAIAVGALVGFSVRYYGAGIDKIFGGIGSLFALLGCALGNLLSQVAFIADTEKMSYLDVVSFLDMALTVKIFAESFSPMDIVFYGIAGYEGYKFAFRRISSEDLQALAAHQPVSLPFSKFRIPTLAVLFIVLSLTVVFFYRSSGGMHTFKYESGANHYQGATENGLETGLWTYWWENGNLQQKGYFKNGKQDSVWESYNEDGVISRRSSYKLKNQHGSYQEFFPNGQLGASGKYAYGRQTGLWKFYQQDGTLSQQGYFFMDLTDSLWEFFFPNGKLRSKGNFYHGEQRGVWTYYFENGSPSLETDYGKNGKLLIKNMWTEDGKQPIKDGHGVYTIYYPNGSINETGKISNGLRSGIWKTFSTQAKLLEEGEYKDYRYYLINSWSFDGKPMVKNGDGEYENYYNDSTGVVKEGGKILKGIRTREWEELSASKAVIQKSNYMNGLLEGKFQTFFETGEVSAEGSFHEDKRTGDWIWYYQNGSLESTISLSTEKKRGRKCFLIKRINPYEGRYIRMAN